MKNPFDNPVYRLDLRSRVREKRLWILSVFFVLVPLALSLLGLVEPSKPGRDPFPEAGQLLGGFALFSHGALLVLLSALGAAQRISQERERRTLPALVNSPLSAARIADGKLLGAWTFSAWLACLTLPFLAVASLWGGLSAGGLLCAWLLNVAAAFAAAALALGLSGLFGRSLSAYLATGAVLFLWCAVVPIVGAMVGGLSDPEGAGLQVLATLAWYHLPLAPQVWLFTEGFDGENVSLWPPIAALAVWTLVAWAGRALAVRGLKREVY